MISNNRRTSKPQSLKEADVKWKQIALSGGKGRIEDKIYKGTQTIAGIKRHLVREKLVTIYHGKCAYCEIKELKPEIEHYRPIKRNKSKNDPHDGYYWLCYEWTNLLPSCRYCNTEGGKGNDFPVAGKRETNPPKINSILDENECKVNSKTLLDERPYLLNPETDDPKMFLRFNKIGKTFARKSRRKGKETIRICNLNRDNLIYFRQKLVKDFLERVEDQFTQYFKLNKDVKALRSGLFLVFERIDQKCKDKEPFTLMARTIREEFDEFIACQLPTPIQIDFAKTIYHEYRKQYPVQ